MIVYAYGFVGRRGVVVTAMWEEALVRACVGLIEESQKPATRMEDVV